MEKYEGYLATLDVLKSCNSDKLNKILKSFPTLVFKVIFSAANDEALDYGFSFDFHGSVWNVKQDGHQLTVVQDNMEKGVREVLVLKDFSKINKLEKRTLKDAAAYLVDDMEGRVEQSFICFMRLNDGYKIYLKEQTEVEDKVVDEKDSFIDVRAKYFQNGFELIKSPSLEKKLQLFSSLTKKEKANSIVEILSKDRETKKTLEYMFACGGKLAYKGNTAVIEVTDEHDLQLKAEFFLDANLDALLNNQSSGTIAKIIEKQPQGLVIEDSYKLDYSFVKPPYMLVYEGEEIDKDEREYYIDNHSLIVLKQERTKALRGFRLEGNGLNKTLCEVDKNEIFKDEKQM